MKESKLKLLVAGFAGLVALITYALTMAPTVSFWDCGEFIASAYGLGIPHPPGTPFFVFFSRVVILALPFIDEIAKRVNYISVVSSAATVFMIVVFTWDLLAKFMDKKSAMDGALRKISLAAGGLTAGFLLAFSDTFWFNAVEAEVYGFAMFLVVLISWLGFKWLDYRNTQGESTILILICYLAFLGVGVHLYTLLTIPAIFILILLGSDNATRIARWPVWITGTILCSMVYKPSSFLPWALLTLLVLTIINLVVKNESRPHFRLSLWLTIVAILGYSTHFYIPIRSALDPNIDENQPEVNVRNDKGEISLAELFKKENWQNYNDYIERKQYGSESMIERAFHRRAQFSNQLLTFPHMGFGGYQLAQYTPFKVGEVNYVAPGIYDIETSDASALQRGSLTFDSQMEVMGHNKMLQLFWFVLFNGAIVLIFWVGFKRKPKTAVYMMLLYLISSAGLLFYINFSDGTRLEKRDTEQWVRMMESESATLASRGINMPPIPDPNELLRLRLQMHHAPTPEARAKLEQSNAWRQWRAIQAGYTSAGFGAPDLPTPVHLEVRERDYFYAPAFIFMSMIYGVGLGLLLLSLHSKRGALTTKSVAVAVVVLSAALPLFANYKEHNRSNLWVPWDYAYNLLMSCAPNSVIFTNGDNDTFPLWFAQEVANIRRDVRVVNLSLGNTDWYIDQIKNRPVIPDSVPALKLSYSNDEIKGKMVLSEDNMHDPTHRVQWWLDNVQARMPTLQAQIATLDSLVDLGVATPAQKVERQRKAEMYQVYDALVVWGTPRAGGYMKTQDKLVFDIALSNPDRPLHFANTVGSSNFVGLDKYMIQQGMVYTLQRGDLKVKADRVDVPATQYLVDSVYKYRGLGDGTAYIDGETERLLFNYNTIYIRMALEVRESISLAVAQRTSVEGTDSTHLVAAFDAKIDSLLQQGMSFCQKGMTQFPNEWRNYAIAAELQTAAGKYDAAISTLKSAQSRLEGGAAAEIARRISYLEEIRRRSL